MGMFQMTIKVINRGEPHEVWFVFESPNCGSVRELSQQLIADGGVSGVRHETRVVGEKLRQISESYEAFIDRSVIVGVTDLRSGLLDRRGAVLA